MKNRLVIAMSAMLFAISAFAADGYLCVVDLSTGFKYDKEVQRWVQANFKAGERFLLTRTKQGQPAGWLVKKFGQEEPYLECEKEFNNVGNLLCMYGFGGDFRFNKNNLRFIHFYSFGYWVANNSQAPFEALKKDGGDTPYIEIGTCAAL